MCAKFDDSSFSHYRHNGGAKFIIGHVTLITPLLRFVVHMLGLDIAYLYTKFYHSSFSRSGDMIAAQKFKRFKLT